MVPVAHWQVATWRSIIALDATQIIGNEFTADDALTIQDGDSLLAAVTNWPMIRYINGITSPPSASATNHGFDLNGRQTTIVSVTDG